MMISQGIVLSHLLIASSMPLSIQINLWKQGKATDLIWGWFLQVEGANLGCTQVEL